MGDKIDFLLIPIKIQPALKTVFLKKSFISAPGRGECSGDRQGVSVGDG